MLFAQERVPRALGIGAARAGYELTVLEKDRTAPTPGRAGRTREAGCHIRIADLYGLLAFPSGELFASGRPCPLLPRETTNELGEIVTTNQSRPGWK